MYEIKINEVTFHKGPFYNSTTDTYDRYDIVRVSNNSWWQGFSTTPNPYWGDGIHSDSLQYVQAAVRNPRKFRFYLGPCRGSMGELENGMLHIVPR